MRLGAEECGLAGGMRGAETTELLALCELTGVHMDRASRKAVAFPPDLREKIAAAVAPQA